MRKKKQEEYYGGRIKHLVETVAKLVQKNPEYASNLPYLHTTLAANLEGYGKRDKCYNCARSMKITVYTADLHDALLILAMAREVKKNIEKTDLFNGFTEANKVHIPTLGATQATLKRQTKCDYLGLIKQPENWKGTAAHWILIAISFYGNEVNVINALEERERQTYMRNTKQEVENIVIKAIEEASETVSTFCSDDGYGTEHNCIIIHIITE